MTIFSARAAHPILHGFLPVWRQVPLNRIFIVSKTSKIATTFFVGPENTFSQAIPFHTHFLFELLLYDHCLQSKRILRNKRKKKRIRLPWNPTKQRQLLLTFGSIFFENFSHWNIYLLYIIIYKVYYICAYILQIHTQTWPPCTSACFHKPSLSMYCLFLSPSSLLILTSPNYSVSHSFPQNQGLVLLYTSLLQKPINNSKFNSFTF